MAYSGTKDYDNQNAASLTIGSDLCVVGCNDAWRTARFPGAVEPLKQRIDKIFPGTDVAAHVLHVLASGEPREMVVVSIGTAKDRRYLCANFYPQPEGAKPPKVEQVLMQVRQTNATRFLDAEPVRAARREMEMFFGRSSSEFTNDGWRVHSVTEEEFEAALEAAERKGSHHLGQFRQRTPEGRKMDLASILALVDGYKC